MQSWRKSTWQIPAYIHAAKSHFTVSFTRVNRGLLLASRVHHLQCCMVWYPVSPMEDLHWLHRVIIWRHMFTNGVAKSDTYVIVVFTRWNKCPYSPQKNKLMLYLLHAFTAISYDNSCCLWNDFSYREPQSSFIRRHHRTLSHSMSHVDVVALKHTTRRFPLLLRYVINPLRTVG